MVQVRDDTDAHLNMKKVSDFHLPRDAQVVIRKTPFDGDLKKAVFIPCLGDITVFRKFIMRLRLCRETHSRAKEWLLRYISAMIDRRDGLSVSQ